MQYSLQRTTLEIIYFSYIRPLFEYGSVVWDGCSETNEQALEKVQLAAARVVTGALKSTPIEKIYEETGWETLAKRREHQKLVLLYKIFNRLTPDYLYNVLPKTPEQTAYNM